MSTSTLTRRMPTKRDGFSWARIPQDSGGVLYRLYRRDMRGVLHVELLPFSSDWECCRCVVARRLREARHRLRDTVDDIDLEIMGLTLELSCRRFRRSARMTC